MRSLRLFSVILCICLCFAGCGRIANSIGNLADEMEKVLEVTFDIPDYNLQITATRDFEKTTEGAWNLQITDKNAYISIMAYKYVDLSGGQTTKDVYDFHNNDIFSRKQNVSTVDDESSETVSDKRITRTRYSAESDGNKNYYDSYLVDFKDEGVFAWVLVTSVPSYMESKGDELKDIVYTLKIAENTVTE